MAAPQAVLEEYFDFLDENTIRIRGRRVGIELILDAYKAGKTPEEIAEEFDTIRLEDVYATITYYLRNRKRMTAWLERLDAMAATDMPGKRSTLLPPRSGCAGSRVRRGL